jgi:predicted permease
MGRLLAWLLGDDDRRAFESEQAELFEARREREGAGLATRRRFRDRLSLLWRLLVERAGSPEPDEHPRPNMTEHIRNLWRDVRLSLRSLARTPGLSATIVLTVGLGLGATTAMVGVIRALLIDPLPYREADNIFMVRTRHGENLFPLSVMDYRALQAQQTTLENVAAYQLAAVTVMRGGSAERVRLRIATPSYFSLLGLTPAAGRLIEPADAANGVHAVVLGAAYWRSRFGADPHVVGTTITVDGVANTIVGVLAAETGPLERDLALYTAANWPTPTRQGPFFLSVLVRPRPGVSAGQAGDELRAINRRAFPAPKVTGEDDRPTWALVNLKTRVLGAVSDTLWLVLAGVAGVLLIACANAASLLVARSLYRSRDLAVRSALGASRGRIARECLTESAVLLGAALGVAVAIAAGALHLVAVYGGDYVPRVGEIRLSGPALTWLAGLAAICALAIGLFPALNGMRAGSKPIAGVGTRSVTEGPSARRLRRALVVAEFAMATPLVVAAALIAVSLDRLVHVDVGMDQRHLTTASIDLPESAYGSPAAVRAFWDRATDRFSAWPGVESVAYADSRPPLDVNDINNFDLEDHPTPPAQAQPVCPWIDVSRGYFQTAGLQLERGRLFTEADYLEDAPPVVVVDRAWARRFFAGEEVIGRRLISGGCVKCPRTTVVGVVGTVKYLGLDRPDQGTVYTPMSPGQPTRYVFLRTKGDAAQVSNAFVRVVRELDATLAVSSVATIEDRVTTSTEMPRYLSLLVGAFAATALSLAVVGIYGVMTHFVTRHARDIGIRLALGGTPARVGLMVVLGGLRLAFAGVVAGLGAAFLLTRLMSSVLFGVTATDATTFIGVAAVMIGTATMACLAPARAIRNMGLTIRE